MRAPVPVGPRAWHPALAEAARLGPLPGRAVVVWVAVGVCGALVSGWLLGDGTRPVRRARQLLGAGPVHRSPSSSRWGASATGWQGRAAPSQPWPERKAPGDGAAGGRGFLGADAAGPGAGSPAGWGRRRFGGRRGAALLSGPGVAAARPSWPAALWPLVARREVGVLVASGVVAVLGRSVLPLVVGLAVWPLARRARRADGERRTRARRVDAVITLCGALAGEVRAGRHPGAALLAVVADAESLAVARAAVPAAARFGGDVPAALAGAAREPGAEGLLGLAACWRVAVDGGAGLAAGLDRLSAALRAERDQRAELRARLAGARSTAVLLAWLPVLGLGLGTVMGADPLHVLLHTGVGLGCLVAGGALEAAGLWWALRIVRDGAGG